MRVGIVDMDGTPNGVRFIVSALVALGCEPFLLSGFSTTKAGLLEFIKESDIRFWICSGSELHVAEPGAPTVPLELLDLPGKRFLMICFSMESVLVQLGLPLRRRGVFRREPFRLTVPRPFAAHPLFEGLRNPQNVWRSHHWYVPRTAIEGAPSITSVSSYNGESMIALYKNAVLVQYHPERSKDGRQFLGNWLKGG